MIVKIKFEFHNSRIENFIYINYINNIHSFFLVIYINVVQLNNIFKYKILFYIENVTVTVNVKYLNYKVNT